VPGDDAGGYRVEDEIRDILRDVGQLGVPVEKLEPDTDLFTSGLTSFATVNVMLAIEDRFDLEFPDRLLKRDSFRSIASLGRVITELRGGAPA
jgi:acyl carrier protein